MEQLGLTLERWARSLEEKHLALRRLDTAIADRGKQLARWSEALTRRERAISEHEATLRALWNEAVTGRN